MRSGSIFCEESPGPTGQTVTQKITRESVSHPDFGNYHVRAHVYFSDLGRYFYSQTKVVEVTDARPIWKQVWVFRG